jgi:hypothetical protein
MFGNIYCANLLDAYFTNYSRENVLLNICGAVMCIKKLKNYFE